MPAMQVAASRPVRSMPRKLGRVAKVGVAVMLMIWEEARYIPQHPVQQRDSRKMPSPHTGRIAVRVGHSQKTRSVIMRFLVTGSSGHLGEALVRTLQERGRPVLGLDLAEGPLTNAVGSIVDRPFVRRCLADVQAVLHTATLHRPHIGSHGRQAFVDTNVAGTLCLLEEAAAAGVAAFVMTSTTSVFGDALVPPAGAPAA